MSSRRPKNLANALCCSSKTILSSLLTLRFVATCLGKLDTICFDPYMILKRHRYNLVSDSRPPAVKQATPLQG
ncbi:hypothetical protein C8Q74DRAFT_1289544 [Fomes fomentarius]|nr:hypothetical protein C8Q74DRAFT_1289544 [Fomes fomentarius]